MHSDGDHRNENKLVLVPTADRGNQVKQDLSFVEMTPGALLPTMKNTPLQQLQFRYAFWPRPSEREHIRRFIIILQKAFILFTDAAI